MNEILMSWAEKIPGVSSAQPELQMIAAIGLVVVFALLAYALLKLVLVKFIHEVIRNTESKLDDVLLQRRVFSRIAYLLPAWIVYQLVPPLLAAYPVLAKLVSTGMAIYLVLVATIMLDSLIDSCLDIYRGLSQSQQLPVKSFAQVAKLLIYFVAVIIMISILVGESPLKLFAGLGAIAAVLMLVFKDPILGFVAGVQLSYNKMVAPGDWVDIPQHDASGDILEIGLTTVKVQNFDNTVTTVPTQSLINDSFKNWRGMQESAGRRIKRAINIDVNSIQFCDDAALARYSKVDFIKEYITTRQQEVVAHNQAKVQDPDSIVNGRRLTNIGTFRAYIIAYLQNHPQINQELTLMVRQLAPTDSGLPLEIYAFSSAKDWAVYEGIQADIFDHLFAVAKEFDLRVFQNPAGVDFRVLAQR